MLCRQAFFRAWITSKPHPPSAETCGIYSVRAKTIPLVVDPESAADLRPLEQRGGLRWDVEWDRAEQQARGEDGDRVGWSQGVARAATLCPPTHAKVRSCPWAAAVGTALPAVGLRMDPASSLRAAGGVLRAKLACQDRWAWRALHIIRDAGRMIYFRTVRCLLTAAKNYRCRAGARWGGRVRKFSHPPHVFYTLFSLLSVLPAYVRSSRRLGLPLLLHVCLQLVATEPCWGLCILLLRISSFLTPRATHRKYFSPPPPALPFPQLPAPPEITPISAPTPPGETFG